MLDLLIYSNVSLLTNLFQQYLFRKVCFKLELKDSRSFVIFWLPWQFFLCCHKNQKNKNQEYNRTKDVIKTKYFQAYSYFFFRRKTFFTKSDYLSLLAQLIHKKYLNWRQNQYNTLKLKKKINSVIIHKLRL